MTEQSNPWLKGPPTQPDGRYAIVYSDPYTEIARLSNPEWWQRFADGNWWAIFGGTQPRSDEDEPVNVAVKVGQRDGKAVVIGLLLESPDGSEITARALRKTLSLPQLLETLGQVYARRGDADPLVADAVVSRPRRPGPRGWPDAHYQQVAEVYSRNLKAHPRRPMKITAEQFGTSEATARRWVARARKLGYLEGEGR
ncbi:MAG: hypothetical protein M3O70_21575 [Actinomycetota bacterium]|nr:hypothetical protein [Actinomycetota bacterium]